MKALNQCSDRDYCLYYSAVFVSLSLQVRKDMIDQVSGKDTFEAFVIRMGDVSSSLHCCFCNQPILKSTEGPSRPSASMSYFTADSSPAAVLTSVGHLTVLDPCFGFLQRHRGHRGHNQSVQTHVTSCDFIVCPIPSLPSVVGQTVITR